MSTGKDRQAYPEPVTYLGREAEQEGFLELNEIIIKACANHPAKRYQTAGQLHEGLLLLQSGRLVKRRRVMEHYLSLAIRLGSGAAILALLAAVGYLYQARQTRAVKKLADKNFALAQENVSLAKESRERLVRWDLGSGERMLQAGDPLGALPWFVEVLKTEAGDVDRERIHRIRLGTLMRQAPRLVCSWTLHEISELTGSSPDDGQGIEFSADRKRINFTGSHQTNFARTVSSESGIRRPARRLGSRSGLGQPFWACDSARTAAVLLPAASIISSESGTPEPENWSLNPPKKRRREASVFRVFKMLNRKCPMFTAQFERHSKFYKWDAAQRVPTVLLTCGLTRTRRWLVIVTTI